MSKIAFAAIVKDDSEYNSFKRALSTVKDHVDGIFITTTAKPNKKIKKLVEKAGGIHSYFEWIYDFSAARNFNFAQVPDDFEWIFWMDADDVLANGANLREAVRVAEANNIDSLFARYLYQVELDEKGNIKDILIEHLRERLIRNNKHGEWVAPIHETYIEKYPTRKADYSGFHIIHLTDINDMLGSMWRNIEILENSIEKDSSDPRPIYYLAKAYFDTREPSIMYESAGPGLDSITMELIKDYLKKSGWPEERAQAYEYLAMIHRERGEYKKAIQALLESLYEWPQPPSVYIQLALTYCMLNDWEKAMHWVKVAGNVEIPKTTLVVNPRDYKSMILEALYNIYVNTNDIYKAKNVMDALVDILPTDQNKQRHKDINQVVYNNDLAKQIVALAQHLQASGQMDKMVTLVNSIPEEIAQEPIFMQMRNTYMPPKTWSDNSVVIWCGPGWEKWSPKNASKGIGGSEEAVIYLSKELAKLGWDVTVYADPQDEAGDYDGVHFRPYTECNWQDNFNIFISWRQIGLFDRNINAKKTYLWNHDIQIAGEYTDERVAKIDKIIFLSKWHRDNVPHLPEDKIMYSANGLNI